MSKFYIECEDYTFSTNGPICPHCGKQYFADERRWFDESNLKDFKCDKCKNPMKVEVETETTWTCYKKDKS